MAFCFTHFRGVAILSTNISQGSILTRLRFGGNGMFTYRFITSSLLSLSVERIENLRVFGKEAKHSCTFYRTRCSSSSSSSIRLLKTLSNATYTKQDRRIELKYNAIQ